jgi:hypothetical protein
MGALTPAKHANMAAVVALGMVVKHHRRFAVPEQPSSGRAAQSAIAVAGKPHQIKEENYLLFGLVEEKAMKAASSVITFDFWSLRRNVLHNQRMNAACVLQSLWRAYHERRRRASARALRSAQRSARALASVGLGEAAEVQQAHLVEDGEGGAAGDGSVSARINSQVLMRWAALMRRLQRTQLRSTHGDTG